MRFTKLVLATTGIVVALGLLASAASAGEFEFSEVRLRATWARMNFTGGFGAVECEVVLEKELHTRGVPKVRESLIAFVRVANVIRCARGGATALRETLPWHVRYESFTGTLPAIRSVETRIVGFAFKIREPAFGVECLFRSTAANPVLLTYGLEAAGAITSVSVAGVIPCGGFNLTISGTTERVDNGAGVRVRIRLI